MCSSFQKKGIRLQRFLYLFLRGTRLDIDFYGVVWRYQFAFIVAPLKVPTNSAKLPDQGAGAEKMVDSLIKHFRFPLTVMCSAKFQRGCFPANSLWIKEERERERERTPLRKVGKREESQKKSPHGLIHAGFGDGLLGGEERNPPRQPLTGKGMTNIFPAREDTLKLFGVTPPERPNEDYRAEAKEEQQKVVRRRRPHRCCFRRRRPPRCRCREAYPSW